MKTIRLFDTDSHIREFTASVISCMPCEKGFDIILDKSAFFPEGGGQAADTGCIGISIVTDVQEIDGIIHHYCKDEVTPEEVICTLDWKQRFSRMQNHSGEHIFSGIIHNLTSFDNVGFHMGEDYMTIDFSGEIDADTLKKAEIAANKAIFENRIIKCYYPAIEDLSQLDYRSKLELTEDVRIVEIEGIDRCACCAPHVSQTGEIGIIKVLGSMRHRGGTRVFLACGEIALNNYIVLEDNAAKISELLSVKKHEIADAVFKLNQDYLAAKSSIITEKKKYSRLLAATAAYENGTVLIFDIDLTMDELREVVNICLNKAEILSAAFSGDDNNGYTYVIGSKILALNKVSKQLNAELNGRGGGRPEMIQGTFKANRTTIENCLQNMLSNNW